MANGPADELTAWLPDNITRYAPKRSYIKQSNDGVVICVPLRSWIDNFRSGLLAVIFIGMLFFLSRSNIASRFPIPFICLGILVGIYVIFSILLSLFGKIKIVIGKKSYVFTGLRKLGIKKRFHWKAVYRIYASGNEEYRVFGKIFIRSSENAAHYGIVICESKRVRFGGNLSHEKQDYLLRVLNYLHQNRNMY